MHSIHQDDRPVMLWIAVAAIAVHFIEEYALDFPAWALRVSSLPITAQDFHLVNACVALYAIACAAVGWRLPAFSLTLAGLLGVNGVFHAGASLLSAAYSPGAVSGLVLFVPVSAAAYRSASRAGVLSARALVISLSAGALWHVFLAVVFFLKYAGDVRA